MKPLPFTRLSNKEFSPLIVRRYSEPFLFFIVLITDDNLDNLDDLVIKFIKKKDLPETIQEFRNFAGELNKFLLSSYPKTEGIAIVIYADKMTVSSLSGDFMNHEQCRLELFGLLNFMTKV
uniref:Uncharacterized protein n=1 Tax=Dictyoglomus turgidum TaxID=513050 RepID=A0A7C3WM75_9BACT